MAAQAQQGHNQFWALRHKMLKAIKGEAAASSLLSLKFLLPSPTPQKHAKLSAHLAAWNLVLPARGLMRGIQLPALSRSKCLTEASHATSGQKGRTWTTSNKCYYYRQEGKAMANRKQSKDSSKVSYLFPAESDLPAALKSLSQTHSSEQIQT